MNGKRKRLVILIALAAVVFGIVLLHLTMSPAKTTLRYYRHSRAELEENLQAHFENGEALSAPGGVRVTEYRWDGHTIVEYMVTGRGLVPSSQYYGFFYSEDDVPACFQGVEMPLVQISDGEWEWREKHGDNRGRIRRIEQCWFYFEAAF